MCAELSPEQVREYRGTLTEPGKNSPYRDRPVEESLRLFEEMKAGEFPEGSMILRAKIDMASPPTSTCATRPCTASCTQRTSPHRQ